MFIILEGCDGSGKSTLAEHIGNALADANPTDKIEHWHAGPPSPGQHPLDLYERPLWDYRPGTGHHIIADRWHVGEWIYPEILGRTSRADLATWRHIDLFLQSRGAIMVHASPPLPQVIVNVRKRGDDLVKLSQIAGIHAAYSAVMRATHLPKIRYSAIGNPFLPDEVIRLARWAEGQVQLLRPFVTYVGHHKPKYLLLGDVRHTVKDPVNLIPEITRSLGPAFGPYGATSGHFLLTHLPYDLLSNGLGIANACDVDDVEELWEVLGQPKTVTLGYNASRCVTWADGKALHPQYVKRFKSHDGVKYGEEISTAFGL
jgi:hypothetical protein